MEPAALVTTRPPAAGTKGSSRNRDQEPTQDFTTVLSQHQQQHLPTLLHPLMGGQTGHAPDETRQQHVRRQQLPAPNAWDWAAYTGHHAVCVDPTLENSHMSTARQHNNLQYSAAHAKVAARQARAISSNPATHDSDLLG